MIDVIVFRSGDGQYLAQAFAIRMAVFVAEQKVDPSLEMDGYDNESIHYLLIEDGEPLGTARRRNTEKGIKLERFAVYNAHRNRGLGQIILKEVIADIGRTDQKIYLHAQIPAVPFYHRHGFHIKGDAFYEAGIKHYLMEYSNNKP